MGDMTQWLGENWFNLFSSAGIIGGLWFTAVSLHSETKTRRVANLLTFTANYREVWKEFFRSPELARVIVPLADVVKQPVSPAEEFFVHMVISHTSSVYEALKDELLTKHRKVCAGMCGRFSRYRCRKQFGPRPNCCKIKILQHSLNLL
jgi:hypothetical protein